jgi:hypothetical protein
MLSDEICPRNKLFHHGGVRPNEFCPGCGIQNTPVTPSISVVREPKLEPTRAKSLPGPQDVVIGIDDSDDTTPRATKGLYVPSNQIQVPYLSTEAERTHIRTVVNTARQQSLLSRGQSSSRTTGSKGSVSSKKYFFEIQLWVVRYSAVDLSNVHNRQYLPDKSQMFCTYILYLF